MLVDYRFGSQRRKRKMVGDDAVNHFWDPRRIIDIAF
jgi:hypothetical protein